MDAGKALNLTSFPGDPGVISYRTQISHFGAPKLGHDLRRQKKRTTKNLFCEVVSTLIASLCHPKSIITPPAERDTGILHWEKMGWHLLSPGTAFLPRAAPPWGHPAPTSSCHRAGTGATKGLGPGQAPMGPWLPSDTPGVFLGNAHGMSPTLPATPGPSAKFTHRRSSDITRLVASGWWQDGVTFLF